MSPIVATSLLLGLLGAQTVVALSMMPQWEAPAPEERVYYYKDGAPFEHDRDASPNGDARHCKPLLGAHKPIYICEGGGK